MNTTSLRPSSQPAALASQPLTHYDAEVEQRVQAWLVSERTLVWIPILSQENFPDTSQEILQVADAYQSAMRWPICRPEDLLALPVGVTGWLMPADAEDTDVACALWDGEVYILGVKNKSTGEKQFLHGGGGTHPRPAAECAAGATPPRGQSAV